jgi:hypothetical protein
LFIIQSVSDETTDSPTISSIGFLEIAAYPSFDIGSFWIWISCRLLARVEWGESYPETWIVSIGIGDIVSSGRRQEERLTLAVFGRRY